MSIVPDNASVRELTPHANGGSQYGREFKWTNDAGKTVRLRIHGPDGMAPAGSNSATGETYTVQIGRQYQDEDGNFFSMLNLMIQISPTTILAQPMRRTCLRPISSRGCDGCRC
ncbi:polymorphic toxin type 30 domain-containing protein [Krasilnikovia sp. MM14-A1259]|uniref:polymorphic toxin type 30 domain-containing protein n=1 Tax=Krasilnikovia sp. MM14-A1259 TaxID=3373539 RepID=UPI00399C908F